MIDKRKPLYRLTKQEQIAGVCAGLADYFDMDVTLMRVIFVVMAFLSGGAVVILYIVLAIVLPASDEVGKKADQSESIDAKFEKLGNELKNNKSINTARNYLGFGLILFGFWFLLVQIFPEWEMFRWEIVWPVILIIIGILIIIRKSSNER